MSARLYAGPLLVTLAYVAVYYLLITNQLRVEERESDGHTIREVSLQLKGAARLRLAIEPEQVPLVGDHVQRPVS